MRDRRVALKIKIKSLEAESRLIRAEERRLARGVDKARRKAIIKAYKAARDPMLAAEYAMGPVAYAKNLREHFRTHPYFDEVSNSLRSHRINVVRKETRCSLLAHGLIRGKAYAELEQKCHEQPDWARVAELANSFGPCTNRQESVTDYRERSRLFKAAVTTWVGEGVKVFRERKKADKAA